MRRKTEKIYFATSNPHKFDEARKIFSDMNLEVWRLEIECREIQSENLEDIAIFSAEEMARKHILTLFTEDAGLFIDSLKGFPGPYSSYVYETIGRRGVLKLMKGVSNRRAKFVSAVAYSDRGIRTMLFMGEVVGWISEEEKGRSGFAFDSIFIPDEGDGRTFAEMSAQEKNRISHRGRSLQKLIRWLIGAE